MLQHPSVRLSFGMLGSAAGATIALLLTWAWYVSMFPRGVDMGWGRPTLSWGHTILFAACVISGAVVGLALTQFRYMPGDGEMREE